jgi:protein farnesyltransferase subunit beta
MPLVITRSTEVLAQTARVCEYGLTHPTPPLESTKHVAFLTMLGLKDILPRGFVSLDASRPWMMYWVLCALKMLGDDITPHRKRSTTPLPTIVVFWFDFSGLLRA